MSESEIVSAIESKHETRTGFDMMKFAIFQWIFLELFLFQTLQLAILHFIFISLFIHTVRPNQMTHATSTNEFSAVYLSHR